MRAVEFGGRRYEYSWWSGSRLKGTIEKPISLDLETARIKPCRPPEPDEDPNDIPLDPLDVPRPALGMAYDGQSLVLIHADRLAEFVLTHRNQHWCGQNFQFDWHVLYRHCDRSVQRVLWDLGTKNQLSDTMVLDQLIQLATGRYRHSGASHSQETKLYPVNLAVLASEFGVGELDKTDPYRLRYGELIGLTEAEIEGHPEFEGFAAYALKDVLAVYGIYPKQRELAIDLMRRVGWRPDRGQKTFEIHPEAVTKFGPLSLFVQVRASISLAELSRKPLPIDQTKRAEFETAARSRYDAALAKLLEIEPELVKKSKARYKVVTTETEEMTAKGKVKKVKHKERVCIREPELIYTARSRVPQMNVNKLVERLVTIARTIDVPAVMSDGKQKGVSSSAKAWAKYAEADQSGFIAAWVELEQEAKRLEFLTTLNADRTYSNYSLLMRTGRTSASAHRSKKGAVIPSVNVQQIPRPGKDDPTKNLRQCFVADPGNLIWTVDVQFAELRTLSASCRARFGFSVLGDTIKKHAVEHGLDPYETAALSLFDLTEAQYRALDPATRKSYRQGNKPFVLGVPGGLGARKLVVYAATNYDVHLTLAQAKHARKKLVETYSELELHLADRTREALAYQLNLPLSSLPKWSPGFRYRVSRWMKESGKPPKGSQSWEDYQDADDDLAPEAEDENAKLTPGEWRQFWDDLSALVRRAKRTDLYRDVDNRRLTRAVKNLFLYRATTTQGLIRASVNYSQAANFPMQSSLSCAAKEAIWALMSRDYDVRMFLHDELVVHVPEAQAKRKTKEIDTVICEALAANVGMDVPMAVEGALAPYWKKA